MTRLKKDNIDINAFVIEMLPSFLRKPRIIALIVAIIYPIKLILRRFYRYFDSVNDKFAYNSQVCYLRALLNDKFDNHKRRIKILDDDLSKGKIVIATSEAKTNNHIVSREDSNISLFALSENKDTKAYSTFAVYIPNEIYEKHLQEITAYLDEYKLLSKNYKLFRI